MEESNNFVEIQMKKSSSKDGGVGYDIVVKCDGKLSQKEMDDIATIAFNTASKTRIACSKVI